MNGNKGIALNCPDADIRYWPRFLAPGDSRNLFDTLLSDTPWRQDVLQLFGRHLPLPRLQAWYGDQQCVYRYSGIELQPLPWTGSVLAIKKQIELHTGHLFDAVLINLYRHGQDSNGWHADNEPELGSNPVIASLSLGETRRFRLRHLHRPELRPVSLELEDGLLLLMAGTTQQHWQHCLAKTGRPVGPRINLTFRKLAPSL